VIYVLRTGDTEGGFRDKLDFTSDFMVRVKELVTVYPLMTMVMERAWPLLTEVSKAPVRQTKALVFED
jgi:hypothetical protein